MNKKYYNLGFVFLAVTLIALSNCSKAVTKEEPERDNFSNILEKSVKAQEIQVVDKKDLIALGKWTTSDSAEKLSYLTYRVTEVNPSEGERIMTLRIFNLEEKEIYKEDFNSIHTIYPMSLLRNDTGEQLIIQYNLGGSGTELKILSLRNGKIESIIEGKDIHIYGEIAFLPTSSNRTQENKPVQILEIGPRKIDGENRKIIRMFRYKDKKYRFYGSAYYEDILKVINNTIKEDNLF